MLEVEQTNWKFTGYSLDAVPGWSGLDGKVLKCPPPVRGQLHRSWHFKPGRKHHRPRRVNYNRLIRRGLRRGCDVNARMHEMVRWGR